VVNLQIGQARLEIVFDWGVWDENGFKSAGQGSGKGKRFGRGANVCCDEAVVESWVHFFELFYQKKLSSLFVL
jgi:hypothetical protein